MDLARLAAEFPALIGDTAETWPLVTYGLIALAMLVENVFPPVPSELVMPMAGFLVHQGKLQLFPVLLAGLLGTVLGAWFWYGVGRLINEEKLERLVDGHGRWVGIRPADLARSRRWFLRHGPAVVFWGRFLPGIRPFVSVPAGIELMAQPSFLFWTSAGSLIWLSALTLAGAVLGSGYTHVLEWLGPLAKGVWIAAILAALVLLLRLALHLLRQRR